MKILLGICICLIFSAVRAWEIADIVGDTTWLIRGGASQRAMLHTCREAKDQRPFQIEYEDGSLLLKDAQGNCFAAVNGRGVAMSVSEGDPNTDPEPGAAVKPLTGAQVLAALHPSCETAQQAVGEVEKLFAAGRISGGWIFFFADAERAFVVESSSKHFAAQELTRAFCVYANSWKLPGMDETSIAPSKRAYTLAQKDWAAQEMLRRCKTDAGIAPAGSFAVSRFDKNDVNADEFTKARDPHDGRSKIEISVHNDKSAGGFLCEIDKEFPAFLSCVYVAQGAPRRAVYLPIPLGAAAVPQLAAPAETAFGPRDPRIVDFEANLLKEFEATREEARQLLRAGKRDEAAKLLKENMLRQAAKASEFLQTVK